MGNDGRGSWMAGCATAIARGRRGACRRTMWGLRSRTCTGSWCTTCRRHNRSASRSSVGDRRWIRSTSRSRARSAAEPITPPCSRLDGSRHSARIPSSVSECFFVGQELVSSVQDGQLAGRSSNGALGYRGEVLHSVFGGLLEAGVEVSRLSGATARRARRRQLRCATCSAPTWTTHAAYANFARAASSRSVVRGRRTRQRLDARTPGRAGLPGSSARGDSGRTGR